MSKITYNKDTKIVVAGAGAMGSLFGGLLAEGGLEVTLFDVWQEHVDKINASGGLKMVGFGGDRLISLQATRDPASLVEADIVLFQCKALYNREAATSIKHLFGGDTIAISFQNGLGNEEAIGDIVGRKRVLGGLTSQGSSIEGPGRIRNYAELPSQIGEMDGSISSRASAVAALFSDCGLPTEARPNIREDIWKKLFANIAFSATSGVTGLTLGDIAAVPELEATCRRAIAEARAVAAADGISIDTETSESVFYQLVAPGGSGENKSSMRHDIELGRPSEVDFIYASVIALGERHGVETPTLRTLASLVIGIESNHRT